jgi:PEP-CTERM motif
LSGVPMNPVSLKEPTPGSLEEAPPNLPNEGPPIEWTFTPPPAPPEVTLQTPDHGHLIVPPIVPIWWGGGPPPKYPVVPPGPPHLPPSVPKKPPVEVPEPETWMLVTLGMAALLLSRQAMKRRAAQN